MIRDVPNHRRLECLLNRLFRCLSKKTTATLAFVKGIHRWPVDSPHKGLITQKMYSFDDVIMCTWNGIYCLSTMCFACAVFADLHHYRDGFIEKKFAHRSLLPRGYFLTWLMIGRQRFRKWSLAKIYQYSTWMIPIIKIRRSLDRSYLYDGNSYTGNTTYVYRITPADFVDIH